MRGLHPEKLLGRVIGYTVILCFIMQSFLVVGWAHPVYGDVEKTGGQGSDPAPAPNPNPSPEWTPDAEADRQLEKLLTGGGDLSLPTAGRSTKSRTGTTGPCRTGGPDSPIAMDQWFTNPMVQATEVLRRTITKSLESKNDDCSKKCGDPVHLTNGEFVQGETDLYIPSRGMPITLSRTYRSRKQHPGILGYNWFFNYESRIAKTVSGNYVVLTLNGQKDEYTFDAGTGQWTSPERRYDLLTVEADGAVRITKKDGSYLHYDNLGRLDSIVDRFGNRLDFAYGVEKQALMGKSDFFQTVPSGLIAMYYPLTTITDSFGRQVTLAYYGSTDGNKAGRLKTVTDFTGRQILYDYDDNGDLVSVRQPITTDFPQGKITRYSYTTGNSEPNLNHNLISILDGKNQAYITNTYDAQDRISQQVYGYGTFIFNYQETYADGTTKKATITDRNGNQVYYELNAKGFETKRIVYTNRNIRAGEGDYTFLSTYDSSNQLLTETYPRGNGVKYTYDSLGNVTSIRLKTDMAAVDDDNLDLISKIEYEPQFNGVKRTIDPAGNVWVNVFDYEESHRLSPPTVGSSTWIYNAGNPGLGDANGDGSTAQAFGHVVMRKFVGPDDGAADANPANDGVTLGQPALQSIATAFAYNNYGQLLYVVDPEQGRVEMQYYPENDPDGDGQDPIAGKTTAPNGYLKQVVVDPGTGKLNLTTSYGYDRVGNVTHVTDPKGFASTFTVNALNQVTRVFSPAVTLPGGGTATYEIQLDYDENNNLWRRQIHNLDENGQEVAAHPWIQTTYTFDKLDHVTTIVEDTGLEGGVVQQRTTQFTYDNNENMVKITKPEGNVVQFVYDERDLLYKVIGDPNLGQANPIAATVTRNYDANGNVTQVVNPNTHAGTLAYDLFDRLQQTTDALGNKAAWAYDKNSNVTSVEVQDPVANTFSRSVVVYDELSRAFEARRWIAGDIAQQGNYIKATMLFDRSSRLRKVTDDNNRQANLTYDDADRLKESVDQKGNKVTLTYDANSNVTQRVTTELEADGVTTKTFTSGVVVDELDRVTSSRDQGPDGIYGNADDRITSFRYDSRGNLTGLNDPKGTVSKILYDALSRRVETQRDPTGLNIVTRFVYDKNSRLNKYIGIRNNADPENQQHITTYGHDRLDRLVNTLYADGRSVSVSLDAAGNVKTATDQNGSVATMAYDVLERVTGMTIARATGVGGTTARTYEYDTLSRLKMATDNNDPANANDDSTLYWTYDGLSRVLTETQQFGAEVNKTLTYSYNVGTDKLNLGRLTYADGTVVRYGRDVLDRVTDVFLGDNTTNKLANFVYAGFGRTVSRGHFNAAASPSALGTVTMAYDGVKRRTGLYNRLQGGQEIASFEYGFDKVDNRVYTKFLHKGGSGEIYRYDKDYRLTESYYGSSAGDIALAENAVANGNDPVVPGNYERKSAYELDDLGNRLSVTTAGVNGANPVTTAYASDQAGADYKMNRITNVGGVAQTHDANGNVKDDGTYLYTHDAFNRILTVTRKSDAALVAVYSYDASGRRVRKTVTNSATSLNGTSHFVYQGWMAAEEHAVANPGAGETLTQKARYLNGRFIDERICMERADVADVDNDGDTAELQRFYFYSDALSSTRAITFVAAGSSTERIVERVDYDAYGAPTFTNWGPDRLFGTADDVTSTTSLVGNVNLFTGQTLDPETGNYYYRMRYYSPVTGRFLTQDPAGYIDGANMYGYVGNDPLNFSDPMGLASKANQEKGAGGATLGPGSPPSGGRKRSKPKWKKALEKVAPDWVPIVEDTKQAIKQAESGSKGLIDNLKSDNKVLKEVDAKLKRMADASERLNDFELVDMRTQDVLQDWTIEFALAEAGGYALGKVLGRVLWLKRLMDARKALQARRMLELMEEANAARKAAKIAEEAAEAARAAEAAKAAQAEKLLAAEKAAQEAAAAKGPACPEAQNPANATRLNKQLASEAQMGELGEIIAGKGTNVPFRDAQRVATQHGGEAADWVKMRSPSHTAPDGTTMETHWVENLKTGERVEYKTKTIRGNMSIGGADE